MQQLSVLTMPLLTYELHRRTTTAVDYAGQASVSVGVFAGSNAGATELHA